jgi:hypothetical protein
MQDYYTRIITSSKLGLGSLVKSIRKDSDFLNYVINETSFLENSADLPFRLFHIRNNLKNQIMCKYCGSPLTKIRISFCNKKCSAFYSNADLLLKDKKSKSISNSHSKKTKQEKEDISKKRENTNLERYGVTNNLHIPEVKEKIVKKWIEKYGYDRPSKSDKIKEILSKKAKANSEETVKKAKMTSLKKYGSDNIMKTALGKKRVADSNIKKYGFPSPMQNPEFCKNYFTNHYMMFSAKEFVLPSGKIIKLLGFEPQVLTQLLKKFDEDDILIGYSVYEELKCTYNKSGKTHKYIPDFYIKSKNLVIEVKSNYTYMFAEPNKRHSVKNIGASFVYAIYEKNKIKFKRYEKTKS